MQNRVKIKEKLKGNILFHALPFAILISALTITGLFGGFALGKGLWSSIAGFAFSLFFSLLGFFFGLFISYLIVKEKYLMKGL
ncbi:MAG: hypothetical protein KAU16_04545 [Methanophagales archaeon]|nr:hypothetical protein [Methanophagales archaeon]